jgi:integrase
MAAIEARQLDDGSLSYRVKVRLKGHPVATGTFTRLTDAKRWAQSTEAGIREGRYFKTAEVKRHTLADLVDRYINEVLPTRPKNASNTKQHLNWWKTKLGSYALSEVTPALIVKYRNDLLATTTRRGTKMANGTVVRYMASLSHAFSIAVKDWQWIDDSPLRKVTKPKEPRGRERFLSDDERKALLQACQASTSRFLYTVVVLALSTGMRRGEIMSLRWSQIDLANGRILLFATKNDTSRAIPLAGMALTMMAALAKVRRIDTDLVFHGEVNDQTKTKKGSKREIKPVDLTKPWKTALTRAKVTNFRFHDLRHSAASYLAMNSATTIEIAAILGHKTLQMVKRYSHLANSHTSSVVTAMNEKIFGSAVNA